MTWLALLGSRALRFSGATKKDVMATSSIFIEL